MKESFICIITGLFLVSSCTTTKYYKNAIKLKNNERGAVDIDSNINVISINGDEKASSLQGNVDYKLYMEPGEYIFLVQFVETETKSGIDKVICNVEAGNNYLLYYRYLHWSIQFKCEKTGKLKQ